MGEAVLQERTGGGSRAEVRRATILEATLRVVATGGIDAVTHRSVAAEAGVPLGSISYYFDSRPALLGEAFRYYLAYLDRMQADLLLEFPDPDAEDVVDAFVEFVSREFADRPLVQAEYELLLYASRDPELARDLNAFEERMIAVIARMLDTVGVAHPFDGGRTLLQLLRGFELSRLSRPAGDVEDFKRRLRGVVAGLLQPAPRAERPG